MTEAQQAEINALLHTDAPQLVRDAIRGIEAAMRDIANDNANEEVDLIAAAMLHPVLRVTVIRIAATSANAREAVDRALSSGLAMGYRAGRREALEQSAATTEGGA
jgi:hypothetical protein